MNVVNETFSPPTATPTSSMVVVKIRPRPRCAASPNTTSAVIAAPANAPAGSSQTARAASPRKIISTAPSDAPAETPRMRGLGERVAKQPLQGRAGQRQRAADHERQQRGSRMFQTTVSCQVATPIAPLPGRCASARPTSPSEMCAGPKATAAISDAAAGSASASANTQAPRCTRAFVADWGATVGVLVIDRSAGMSRARIRGETESRATRTTRRERRQATEGKERSKARAAGPLFPRRGEGLLPSVGLLARGSMLRALPLPRRWRRRRSASSGTGDCFPTDSGGTAPVFHRSSLLSPDGHRKRFYSVVRKNHLLARFAKGVKAACVG